MTTQAVEGNEIADKLIFVRGFLVLLRDTRLFGPLLERAIDELDDVVEITLR